MTDTKALVERLRDGARNVEHARHTGLLDYTSGTEPRIMREAADALEALSRPAGEGEVERVARAMFPDRCAPYSPDRHGRWAMYDHLYRDAVHLARAAIAAMRPLPPAPEQEAGR